MKNGIQVKTEPTEHVNELLNFIDNSLDAYKETDSIEESHFNFSNKKGVDFEENFMAFKRKVIRLKKALEIETVTRQNEIKHLKAILDESSLKNSKILFFCFSWLLSLTILFFIKL